MKYKLKKHFRFEQQIQEEEDSFQQQRRRLYSEIEEEKQRISELLQTAKKEFDERRNAYENTSRQMLTSLQEDSNKQLREMQDNCQVLMFFFSIFVSNMIEYYEC